MIKLIVRFIKPVKPFGQTTLSKLIKAIDERLKPGDIEIGLRVTEASEVRQLNKKYAGKDEETDVLSFNYAESSPVIKKAGDIVISYQHTVNQAKQAGTSRATELALLMMHGILHILGHDHQTESQRDKLDKLQADIMKTAGLTYRNFEWIS